MEKLQQYDSYESPEFELITIDIKQIICTSTTDMPVDDPYEL